MTEFTNESLSTNFTVPDEITVLAQMRYASTLFELRGEEIFWRQFKAACVVIEDWESAVIPEHTMLYKEKLKDDEPEDALYLSEATDPRILSIIMWAGAQVGNHVAELKVISKN